MPPLPQLSSSCKKHQQTPRSQRTERHKCLPPAQPRGLYLPPGQHTRVLGQGQQADKPCMSTGGWTPAACFCHLPELPKMNAPHLSDWFTSPGLTPPALAAWSPTGTENMSAGGLLSITCAHKPTCLQGRWESLRKPAPNSALQCD